MLPKKIKIKIEKEGNVCYVGKKKTEWKEGSEQIKEEKGCERKSRRR